MSDRAAFVEGLEMLAGLYWQHPELPIGAGAQAIDLHQYGSRAIERTEQIRLAVAVIHEMRDPKIYLRLNRSLDSAWIDVRGHLAGFGRLSGLSVTVTMWADDVCERRPEARLKRDRWVIPAEIQDAVRRDDTPQGGDL